MPWFPDAPSPVFGEASVAFREKTEQIYSGQADTQNCLGRAEALLLIHLCEISAKGQKWVLFIQLNSALQGLA